MNLFRNFFKKAAPAPTQPTPARQSTSQEKEEDYTFDVVG